MRNIKIIRHGKYLYKPGQGHCSKCCFNDHAECLRPLEVPPCLKLPTGFIWERKPIPTEIKYLI